MSSTKRIFIFLITSTLMILSCRLISPDAPAPTTIPPTVSETEAPEEPTSEPATEMPTEEAVTEAAPTEPPPTEAPTVSQDELIERWRFPIEVMVIVATSCDSMLETAEKLQSGEIDSFETFGELLAAGILLSAAEEGNAEWEPTDMAELKPKIQDHIDIIQDVFNQWIDDEITSEDVPDLLDGECEASYDTLTEIGDTAGEEGITDESLDSIIEDISTSLDEIASDVEIETPDIPSEVGYSRSNPFQGQEVNSVPGWDIQVLEVIRDDEAWQMISAAYSFNDPPEEGMEYLLVKLRATSTATDEEEHYISAWDFNLTGSRLIQNESAFVVEPEPELDAYVYAGGEAEGYLVFSVGIDEDNLILIVDPMYDFDDEYYRFIALDEGASIDIPPELTAIPPTALGTTRSSPAPLGETVITEDWELTIVEVVRGDGAWEMVQEANSYNDPPDDGMEYVAAKVLARYIGVSNQAESIDVYPFESTGSANVLHEVPFVYDLNPELDVYLFPGGEYEGWIVLQVEEDETGIMAVFTTFWDDESRRFLSLE